MWHRTKWIAAALALISQACAVLPGDAAWDRREVVVIGHRMIPTCSLRLDEVIGSRWLGS